MKFTITDGKGFHMKFANGYTVSVQWGNRNYCENSRRPVNGEDYYTLNRRLGEEGCPTAEVAVWCEGGELEWQGADDVIGWRTPEQVAAIIFEVSNRPLTKSATYAGG